MKKIFTLFLLFSMMLLFITCRKGAASKHAGVYCGTLSSPEITKKDSVEFYFGIDVSNEEILTLFEQPLKRGIENQYTADGTIVLDIIHILYPRTVRAQIANTSALFVFEENEVMMDMTYSLVGTSENMNIRFIGKKR